MVASTEGNNSKTGTGASNGGNAKETEKLAGAEGNVNNANSASVFVTCETPGTLVGLGLLRPDTTRGMFHNS